MNVWRFSLRNIKSKPLYTFLGVFILALSISLLLGIGQLKNSLEHQMDNNLGGVDMVIGAKGSPLQLVLSSVLHLDNPTGNISYKAANNLAKNPLIKTAVPISYGDNYKGFRIVGTTDQFLNLYGAELEKGHRIEKSMEVILGSAVAEQQNLRLGDTFLSSHGLMENDGEVHDEEFVVVGILNPTQKVIDRLIVTNLESIWDVHDHKEHEVEDKHTDNKTHEHEAGDEHEHHNEEHDDEKEITSMLIVLRSPAGILTLPRAINDGTVMQAALPRYELVRLLEFTGVGFKTISIIAYLILIISGMTIFLSLYKMVKERAFDLALLRTYGASNFQLIKMVSYEGLLIAFMAFTIGFILVKVGLNFMLKLVKVDYKQNFLQELPLIETIQIGTLVVIMVVLAISLAIYPLIRMNISTILSNEK